AFWSLFKATELQKTVEESISQVKAHLKDVQNFYANGSATNNDVLKVQVQLSNTELLKIDADNAVQMSVLALNNIIGQPILTQVEAKSEIKFNGYSVPNLQSLIDTGFQMRPDVKALQLRIKAGEYGVSMSKAGWYPQINLAANYNFNRPNSRIMPTRDEFIGTWDVGLNLSMDLWNWMTTSHQTAQAEATLEQTKLGLSQFKDAIILEISQNYLTLLKSKEKITVSEQTVQQAEENYRVTNEKYKAGTAINSDLIDAETALLQAKINLTSALVDFELSIAKLEKSIGK
ncbi:MAG: TolC family protein, partial [Bacteroidota bacterium]